MKRSFQFGERVKVYGVNTQSMTLTGEVVDMGAMNVAGFVWVKHDKNPNTSSRYCIEQCRRLKKVRRQPVSIFITQEAFGHLKKASNVVVNRPISNYGDSTGLVEFRQVRTVKSCSEDKR